MIPAEVDIADLTRQLDEDSVAFGPFMPAERVDVLEPGLIDAVAHADSSGFGSLGVVVLDFDTAHAPDVRDVAQDLLLASDLETVIVRTPGSGAIVSEVHTRADIESAQYRFLGNPDIVGGVFGFIDDVNATSISWISVAAVIVLTVVAVAAFAAVNARRSRVQA